MVRLVNRQGAEKLLPETMHLKQIPLDLNVPTQTLHGLSGAIKTGKTTMRPRQLTIEGRIYHPGDKERIRQDLDDLLQFLSHTPIEVYRQEPHDRFLLAHPQGAMQDWIDLGAELALRIPMIALDPYWYGPEVEVTVSGTQTITVEGNAPTMPLITTTSSVSSLTVSNLLTGKGFAVSGATGVIEVDNDERNPSVVVGGVSRLDLISEPWLLNGFELLPGQNQITTNTPITVTYRPRWY